MFDILFFTSECWSIGVLEYWLKIESLFAALHCYITPVGLIEKAQELFVSVDHLFVD